jgi:DNA-binding IclR family transcriptional regulator
MDRILLALHNLCAVRAELAKTSGELAQNLGMDLNQLQALLKELVSNGYIAYYSDSTGEKRYYITGNGIIRVCSAFT